MAEPGFSKMSTRQLKLLQYRQGPSWQIDAELARRGVSNKYPEPLLPDFPMGIKGFVENIITRVVSLLVFSAGMVGVNTDYVNADGRPYDPPLFAYVALAVTGFILVWPLLRAIDAGIQKLRLRGELGLFICGVLGFIALIVGVMALVRPATTAQFFNWLF